ncbi:MAG: hypothetical protein AB4062_18975 [Crocosphaera sp.]
MIKISEISIRLFAYLSGIIKFKNVKKVSCKSNGNNWNYNVKFFSIRYFVNGVEVKKNSEDQQTLKQEEKLEEIKNLINQLQYSMLNEAQIKEEDKIEALQQIEILAKSAKNHSNLKEKKSANTAIKILKGTISDLPKVTELVQNVNKLIPEIAKLLGL